MANRNMSTDRDKPYPKDRQSGKSESSTLPIGNDYNRELFRIRASRIVDPFPDEMVIQEKTVSVVRREPFASFIETIPVRDIGRVVYANTPFFGGLQVLGKNPSHHLNIKGLNKAGCTLAKELVEGLLLESKGEADIPLWLQTDERRERLIEAGRGPDR